MYHPGEYIVYGVSGVCKVEAVGPSPFEGETRLYYTLRPVYGTETIYIPVHSPVFMRPILTRQQAEELIASIPFIEEDDAMQTNFRAANERCRELLQSHSCQDLVLLAKTLYARARRSNYRVSQHDQHYRKRAEALLHGELAVALGIPLEEVPRRIACVIRQHA